MPQMFILLGMILVWIPGCTSKVGLPVTSLPIVTDRYDKASFKIDNSDIGDHISAKKGSELMVDGQMMRRAAQTFEQSTMGVAFQFRCDNSAMMKSFERDLQILYMNTDFKDHAEYATESGGVISFHGKLRTPKRAGEYELYLSVVESVLAPSGTEVKSVMVPVMRTVMTVE